MRPTGRVCHFELRVRSVKDGGMSFIASKGRVFAMALSFSRAATVFAAPLIFVHPANLACKGDTFAFCSILTEKLQ